MNTRIAAAISVPTIKPQSRSASSRRSISPGTRHMASSESNSEAAKTGPGAKTGSIMTRKGMVNKLSPIPIAA